MTKWGGPKQAFISDEAIEKLWSIYDDDAYVDIPATMLDLTWIKKHNLGDRTSRFPVRIIEMNDESQMMSVQADELVSSDGTSFEYICNALRYLCLLCKY